MKRWQACVMVGLSGYAIGNILAKTTPVLGS